MRLVIIIVSVILLLASGARANELERILDQANKYNISNRIIHTYDDGEKVNKRYDVIKSMSKYIPNVILELELLYSIS